MINSFYVHGNDVVVISDLNNSYGSTTYSKEVKNAVKAIINLNPSLVLITGDMVAGMKHGLDYEAMWDSLFASVINPLRENKIKVAVTPGNHDASIYSNYAIERQIYQNRFINMRNLDFIDDSNYPFSYSFKHLDNAFISLDITAPGKLSKETMSWLEDQLQKLNEFKNIIIFSHLPLYPFAQNRENDAVFDINLEKLLKKYKVKYYFSGHHHAYFPGKKGSLNLISQSCLGAGNRVLIGDEVKSKKSFTIFNLNNGSVEALESPLFDKKVDIESLPSIIKYKDIEILRIDQ